MMIQKSDSNHPKVSIWSITYNHGKFIEECLEGILKQQTTFDFELIIGDDASTDRTSEVLRNYQSKFPKTIKPLIQDKNVGVFENSICKVLPRLKAKYVAICEGDDYWIDPLKLQKQFDYMESHPNCSMCFTNQLEVSSNGELQKKNIYSNKIYTTNDIVKGFIPGTQTIMYRNSPSIKIWMKRHKNSPSQDRLLAYFCSLLGELHLIPEFTAAYRKTGEGVWTGLKRQEQFFLSLETFIKFHISIGIPVNNELVHQKINGAFFYWIKKKPKGIIQIMSRVNSLKKKYQIKTSLLVHLFKKLALEKYINTNS